METLLQDLRYSIQMLLKKPGFTIATVVTLALGIGANSMIFSVVNAVLLRSLPYENPDRLVVVNSVRQQDAKNLGEGSYLDLVDWKAQSQVFEDMAYLITGFSGATMTGTEEPERLERADISANFLSLLGVNMVAGRTFLPGDDQPGAGQMIIVSYGLWQRRFGGDPGVVGRTLTIDGKSTEVVGVLPPGFKFPGAEKADVLVALVLDEISLENRGARFLSIIGRLKPDVKAEEAQTEMDVIASRLEQQYPATNTGRMVRIVPLYEKLVGGVRNTLLILLGTVLVVLLIACSNVANLLLAGAAARQKEFAIRTALGASRSRIIQQLMTESLLLAIVGGCLGLLLGLLGLKVMVTLAPDNIPRLENIRLDMWVFGFTLLISVLTGIIFGLGPALISSRPDINELIKEGKQVFKGGFGRVHMRNLLVVLQMALALVLLISAGLLIRSFQRLQQVDPGFDSQNVLSMRVDLLLKDSGEAPKNPDFFEQLLERIEGLPGVESAGAITYLPFSGKSLRTPISVKNRPAPPKGQEPRAELRAISPNYFSTMKIPLIKGRDFTRSDRRGSPGAIIINETVARQIWPDEDPIGQKVSISIRLGPDDPAIKEVVGVVGDVRHVSLEAEPLPEIYVPQSQQTWFFMSVVVRTLSDPMSLVEPVRNQVQSLDNDQPVYNVRTVDQVVSESIARPRFTLFLFGIFAMLALVLSAIGVFGVMSYSVSQRTREIGIRLAIGAQPGDVIRLVLGRGIALSLIGVVIGLGGAFAITHVMSSLLFAVSPTDPVIFFVMSLLLTGVALLASYLPARRAMKVDPITALRTE